MFELFFVFDGKFYEQCDRVAMGSPLGPLLANVTSAILKTFGWKTVLSVSNQVFTEDSLMIHFYDFEQRIMLKSLKLISTNNMKP